MTDYTISAHLQDISDTLARILIEMRRANDLRESKQDLFQEVHPEFRRMIGNEREE